MMAFTYCGWDAPVVKSNASRVILFSMAPTVIKIGSADVDFVETLVREPMRKTGVQYPFNLSPVQVEKLMKRTSFILMGKIEFFSLLRTMLLRFSEMLDEPRVQATRFLKKIRFAVI